MAPEDSFAAIERLIDSYADEMVQLQRELVAAKGVGPENSGEGEAEKAAVYERWLKSLGLEVDHADAPDERVPDGVRPNLIAQLHGRDERRVWVVGHLDIVPPGELRLWETDPYTLVQKGDRLYGRGTWDNNHALVTAFFAARALLDRQAQAGSRPGLGLAIAAISDEETGSGYGLEYLLKERADLFSPNDLIVVPDAGREDGTMIEVAEKSMLWLKFVLTGKQVHGSTPEKGVNTLSGAAHLIVALEELNDRFPNQDPLFSPPNSTFPPTRKEANVPNINTVPGEDVFYLDCRVLPCYPSEDVLAAVREIAGRVARERGLKVEVEPVYQAPATPPTRTDAPVVKAVERAVMRVYGRRAEPMGIGGGTVAAFFRRAGLPAVVWSSSPDTAHRPNEYCLLSNLIGDAKVLAHLAIDI